ncbi:MAG TPA: 7-carboxy-7-deazaguanine synthase QueE, partial [Candidatus Paceibacterota bacterium]
MFGQNPVSPIRHDKESFLVKDIFYTIQGEGPYAGRPAVFVRLGGCNLRCAFCDTDFSNGVKEMGPHEIADKINRESNTCDL